MPLLTKRHIVTAKLESVYDSDPTPAGSDAVAVENLAVVYSSELIEPVQAKAYIGRSAPILARWYAELNFDVPLAGSGSAGTAPEWGPIIQACGMSETIVGATSVTYEPVSAYANMKSVTVWVYRDGLLQKFTGCRGNWSLNAPAGERGMLHFRLWGHCAGPTDVALATPTFDGTVAPIVKSASFTFGGYAGIIQALTVDMQNALQMTPSVNAASGYGAAIITDRNVLGSLNPEAALVATHDWWSDWEDGTSQALTITIGATAGNIATLTAPACTDRELNPGDRDGIMIYDIPFTCAEDSGNDEVSLALT